MDDFVGIVEHIVNKPVKLSLRIVGATVCLGKGSEFVVGKLEGLQRSFPRNSSYVRRKGVKSTGSRRREDAILLFTGVNGR